MLQTGRPAFAAASVSWLHLVLVFASAAVAATPPAYRGTNTRLMQPLGKSYLLELLKHFVFTNQILDLRRPDPGHVQMVWTSAL